MTEHEQMSTENLTTKEDQAYAEPGPTRVYLSRLVELLSDAVDRTTVMEAVHAARAHAGGKTKAERQRARNQDTGNAPPITTDAFYDIDSDRDVLVEIVEVENPRLPIKFEKTDSRVSYREATGADEQCRDCAFFKYVGDGDSGDLHGCAIVEGRIGKTDTCDLFLSPEEAYAEGEGKTEPMNEHQSMHDLAAADYSESGRAIGFSYQLPVETYNEVPDSIPLLPVPGIYKHPRYGDIVITRERNKRFVENINNHVYQEWLPIDAEHQTKISGAFGWITAASLNEDGSADAQVTWSDKGRHVITEKRFRYISPEWMLRYQDPASGVIHEDVVVAAALTTRPFFKEPALRAIVANERGIWEASEASDGDGNPLIILQMCDAAGAIAYEERSTSVPEERVQHDEQEASVSQQASEETAEASADDVVTEPEAEAVTASEPEVTLDTKEVEQVISNSETQLPTEFVQAFHEMRAALDTANELITAQQAEKQSFKEMLEASERRIAAMEDDAQTKRFTDMISGRAGEDDGGQWFGEPEKHMNMLKSLASAFGEDSEQFQIYVENQRAIAAQQAESELFQELGSQYQGTGAGNSALQRIEAKADKLREQYNDLTRQQAFSRVIDENPELHAEYLAERGIK